MKVKFILKQTGIAVGALTAYYALCFIFAQLIQGNNILLTFAIDIVGSVIGIVVLKKKYRWESGQPPDKQTKVYIAAVMVLMSLASLMTATYIMNHLLYDASFAAYSQQIDSSRTGGLATVLSIAMTVIAAPIMEEVLFRGFIFRAFYDINPIAGYVINIFLFAVMHGTIIHLPIAIAGAVVLSRVYEKSHKLRYNMAAHMLYNLSVTVLGSLTYPSIFFTGWMTMLIDIILLIFITMLFFLWNKDVLHVNKQ